MKIKVPSSVSQETVDQCFCGQKKMSYTDEELGAAIATYRMAEQFLKHSGLCSAARSLVMREIESLEAFKAAREEKP
jgi:hypothetical protein